MLLADVTDAGPYVAYATAVALFLDKFVAWYQTRGTVRAAQTTATADAEVKLQAAKVDADKNVSDQMRSARADAVNQLGVVIDRLNCELDKRDKRIEAVETKLAECDDRHWDCERKHAALEARLAHIETNVNGGSK